MNKLLDWLISNDITASEAVLNSMLMLVGVGILVSLWRMHTGNGVYTKFNLVYLIVNKEGYPDGAKCVEIGSWLLLSWGFIVYVTAKRLPEWYMQWYLIGFVLRGMYGAYLRSKGDPVESVGTKVVTDVTATSKTTEVSLPAASALGMEGVEVPGGKKKDG